MAAEASSDVLAGLLEEIDEHIFQARDTKRYHSIGKRTLELDTMLGATSKSSRRYYRDLQTGGLVFLLDKALKLLGGAKQTPGLREVSVQLATNASYRQARDLLEQVLEARVTSHETVRQCVLKAGDIRE